MRAIPNPPGGCCHDNSECGFAAQAMAMATRFMAESFGPNLVPQLVVSRVMRTAHRMSRSNPCLEQATSRGTLIVSEVTNRLPRSARGLPKRSRSWSVG